MWVGEVPSERSFWSVRSCQTVAASLKEAANVVNFVVKICYERLKMFWCDTKFYDSPDTMLIIVVKQKILFGSGYPFKIV